MMLETRHRIKIGAEVLVGLYFLLSLALEDTSFHVIPNALFVVIAIVSIKGWVKIPFGDGFSICFIGFSILTFLSYIWSWDKSATTLECRRQIVFFIFIFGFTNLIIYRCKFLNLIKWYYISALLISLYIIFSTGVGSIYSSITSGTRVTNPYFQINEVSGLMCTGIVIVLFLYLESKKKRYLLCLIPYISIIIAGESKRAVLMLLISVALLYLLYSRDQGIGRKLLYIVLVVGVLFIVQFLLEYSEVLSGISHRFDAFFDLFRNNEYADDTRIKYYLYSLESIKESPLFGKGAGCSHYVTLQATMRKTYIHNNYLEILVDRGIVGFVLYYGMYFSLIMGLRRYYRNDKYALLMFVLLISQLVSDIAITSYYSKVTYTMFALSYATMLKNRMAIVQDSKSIVAGDNI